MKLLSIILILLLTIIASCKKESNKNEPQGQLPNPAIGELVQIGGLSIARTSFAGAAAGNKIVFAGGTDFVNHEIVHTRVDIFDTVTLKWSTAELSEGRTSLAAVTVGNRILFAGGAKEIDTNGTFVPTSRVDIYDATTNSWTISEMPKAGYFEYTPSAVVGNKAFFYQDGSSEIFVYDVADNSWSTIQFPEPRVALAVASVQNQNIFFAGGYDTSKRLDSKRVDIYNAASNSWSVDSLSEARWLLNATSVSGKTVFAGGQTTNFFSNSIDIYDNSTSTWTTANLSRAYDPVAAITSGEKAVFIDRFPRADIYDAARDTWSTVALYRIAANPDPEPGITAAVVSGDKTFVVGVLPTGYHGVWMTRF